MSEATMVQQQTTSTPAVQQEQKQATTKPKEIKIMERRLDGVMFHIFYADLFELLGLDGFRNFHMRQKREEERSLNKLKSEYIDHCKKLPILNPSSINYWDKYSHLDMNNISESDKCNVVKQALEHYKEWEQTSLKYFISWNENEIAKEILKEIDMIDYIMFLLNKYGYDYENVLYLSKSL